MTPIQECDLLANGLCKHRSERKGSFFLKKLGPGFVTGASDDDPSGLATYAQAGAQVGKNILWFAPWTLPLMISVQEMAGRIGLMTQGGLTAALLKKFSRLSVYFMVTCLVIANTINIGADIAGMAESVQMTTGVPFVWAAIILSIGMLFLQIYLPYKKYVTVLKWCAATLLSYFVAAFTVNMGWRTIAWHALIPHIDVYSNDFWYISTAILGTTISPYLLFWQTSQEIEEKRVRDYREGNLSYAIKECEIKSMREETVIGMFFSNTIMFFVMAVTAAALHGKGGNNNINSMVEAAAALRPLAGDFAAWLFAAGIIGTGLLTVPVLAGSSAYAMAELFGWRQGLHLQWYEAGKFYGVIAASTMIGLALNALGINAVDFLLWSAIINGCVTPIIIVGMIAVANDGALLGRFKNSWLAKTVAWLTFFVFVGSMAGFLLTYKK
jgi:NRAMP (natural resistance-associated macrophage protein)-like metal ion transporter